MQPCYKEEVDDRLLPHVTEQSGLGFKRLMVVTVNTDVVVIDFYAYWDLEVAEVWIEFGKGKEHRWLPNHSYVEMLGRKFTELLSFGLH